MTFTIADAQSHNLIGNEMFGVNVIASRDTIDGLTNFPAAVSDLGATSIRYPGGSVSEYYFDLSSPNQTEATDDTGNFDPAQEPTNFIPLNEFMNYASDNNLTVSIVIPTREALSSETDINGHRSENVDEAQLRAFVRSIASGEYGDANITSFEIGNEYWHSGEMDSVEYGRVASAMSQIIHSELDILSEEFGYPIDIDIIVQTGHNFGYARLSENYDSWDTQDILDDLNTRYGLNLGSNDTYPSGDINWSSVANALIQSEFDDEEFDAIDGISDHIYTDSYGNLDIANFQLDTVVSDWALEDNDLDLHITEWNQATSSDNLDAASHRGMWTAQELLDTFEQMCLAGVDEANIWPVLQNTANALAQGFDYTDLTPAGEIFAMMSESLPGKSAVDLVFEGEEDPLGDLYVYYGNSEAVAFFSVSANASETVNIDLSDLFTDLGEVQISILTTSESLNVGSAQVTTEVLEVDSASAIDGPTLTLEVSPGDIVQMSFINYLATDDFVEVMTEIDQLNGEHEEETDAEGDSMSGGGATDDNSTEFPTTPIDDQGSEEEEDGDEEDWDIGGGFEGAILGLLPLLLLGSLAI